MKFAFVTGGGRGLGEGFVEYLLDQGVFVFSGVRNTTNKDKTDNFYEIELDVTDDDSIDQAFKIVASKTDGLDFLINNAGVNKDTATGNHKELVCDLVDLDRKILIKMFDVNTVSPMIILQKFMPLLKNKQSFVINISSCRASFHDEAENKSGNYGYRGSKIALNMFTFCSLHDLPVNVKTFCVHPGNVKTQMNQDGSDLPYNQAEKMIKITENWKDEYNGKFLNFDGSVYPL